ncbi:ADP-ribosylglycohydrolase family protein [Streptomyces poonensis]|uniref:ADP-ribosylglycohydrolase n=1 Tax=Streptomyces poonensis TaxID=68255 RepID=A0A918PEZ6_9ACTN|nr:ADP-ribosylglycohydrolase family protein [Streptomyces poonensis]GGZ02561.1 ADP-ribosylglycohydrolase [Streptomyces poonensis]GLJ93216.1 ADP-ribosylglycohydrolase [Streptomyces poonensis]
MADEKDREKDQRREALKLQSRVRGMMLGLALGDTVGAARGRPPAGGPLRAGVSTQLACFTAEGIIRASVRGNKKGICYPPGVVMHAYCRWAALQGIEVDRMRRRWVTVDDRTWPDGWLAGVPVLAERRGSAPATVTALSTIEPGGYGTPTTSRGCHALTRALPFGAVGLPGARQARDVAALTHGDAGAQSAAFHATVLVHHCLRQQTAPHGGQGPEAGEPVRSALSAGIAALRARERSRGGVLTDDEHDRLLTALRYAADEPAHAGRLARLAPDPTAPSALLGGLYVAASFPGPGEVRAALEFAAGAPDGDSVACVTGALLGAVHGVEALPVDLVSRHELAWVLDTLARDLLLQCDDSPSGSEYLRGWDPHWWERYPGW